MNASADLLNELRIDREGRSPGSGRPRWLWPLLAVVVLAALAVLLLSGRDQAIEVRSAPVLALGDASAPVSVLDATGYVVARRMATVSAKITGRVQDVLIEEGMFVEEDQVMATLDPIDADAQRALQASQLAAARSQVGSVQAQLREAEANARRLSGLADRQLVSQAQYDQAVAQRDALRAQYTAAQRNVAVASDALVIADIGIDNTTVRAPFAGVVIAKAAQPGEIVSPLSAGGGYTRTGIGTIVDMDSLEVEVEVGEAYIGRVRPDMPVEATLNAYQDWKIPGAVIATIPAADRGKATVKVRIALHEQDPRIVPDMGVRVAFLEAPDAGDPDASTGVRIPAAAVARRDEQDVAFVIGDDGVASRRLLTLGREIGEERQVLDGLRQDERVILDPPASLEDGSRVRIAGTR